MGRVKGRIGKDIWPTVVRVFRLQLWVLHECTSRSGKVGLCRTIPTCPSCSRGEQGSKKHWSRAGPQERAAWWIFPACRRGIILHNWQKSRLTIFWPRVVVAQSEGCCPNTFLKQELVWSYDSFPQPLSEKKPRQELWSRLNVLYYGLIKVGELSFCFKYILHTHLRSVWGREGHYVVFRQRHRLYNNSF